MMSVMSKEMEDVITDVSVPISLELKTATTNTEGRWSDTFAITWTIIRP